MKVAQLIDSLRVGGAQKLLVTLAEAVQGRKDFDLSVISLRRQQQSTIREELERLGVPVSCFPSRGLRDPVHLVRLARFLRSEGVDVLNTHLTYSNILGGLAARMAGVPVVATLHSIGITERRGARAREGLERLVLRRWARKLVAVGTVVADVHRERLAPVTIDVVPNAVPLPDAVPHDEIRAVRAEIAGDPSRTIVLSVGRLADAKGYDHLLDAFAMVLKERPETFLAIAGRGALREELEAQIAELGLQDRAFLLGVRGDVPRLLAASDLFVNSSIREGLPVAVLEAMAAGRPVVATSVGDVPQVVVEGTGVLVPPKQPDRLAQEMLALLGDDERRKALGQAAQDHVRNHYGVDAWVDRLMEIYREAQRNS